MIDENDMLKIYKESDETLEAHKHGESNCCGAGMVNDICLDCKEHCEDISIEEEIRGDLAELARDNELGR